MRNLKSADEVVKVLGGPKAVCKLTKVNVKAVYYWTGVAGTFPARLHQKMLDALERRDCKAPHWLWAQTGYEKEAA